MAYENHNYIIYYQGSYKKDAPIESIILTLPEIDSEEQDYPGIKHKIKMDRSLSRVKIVAVKDLGEANNEKHPMHANAADVFTVLEVCHLFMDIYHMACQAEYRATNDVEQEKIHNENSEHMFYMFNNVKFLKMFDLPKGWLVDFDAYSIVEDILENDNFPKLVNCVEIAQEKVQQYSSKINDVVYSRGNDGGLCQRHYSDVAEKIRSGVKTFLNRSTFILTEMNDKTRRKEFIKELRQYL